MPPRKKRERVEVPPFKEGDLLRTAFKPHFQRFLDPLVVVRIERRHGPVSGWGVWVNTDAGVRMYCASLFSLASPA